jgi:aspartate aminotransferase
MIELPVLKINEIEEMAHGIEGCISFSKGDLRLWGVDKGIKEYVRQMLLTEKIDNCGSPAGIVLLRKKLSEMLSKEHSTKIGIENLVISHGETGALMNFLLAILDENDEVLLPEPTCSAYKNIVLLSKARPVTVPAINMIAHEGWKFGFHLLKQAITSKTRMIILSNPSNPTGMCLSEEVITELKGICEERGIYLVVDESYEDFIFEGDFFSIAPWICKSEFVVRIGSFSRSFAMSGWRVGYLVAPHRLVTTVASVQEATLCCPNVVAQYAVLYGLEHKNDIIFNYHKEVGQSRELVCNFFDELQLHGFVSYVTPLAGFYLFFKTSEEDSSALAMDILRTVKVAVVPGKDFGDEYKSFIRFCFARHPKIVAEGIARLQKYFTARYLSFERQEQRQVM